MSRRIMFLLCIPLLLLGAVLAPAGGQVTVSASPELVTWVTWGESPADAASLADQISVHEENGIYDYWITYSQGAYHIQYGGLVQAVAE
jgi:ABC-type glycerol-3-phosphate transport system substrate-binding protein